MVGTTLRSYHIEAKLGAGSMGVVYCAVDSRLDRRVAIKVLPSSALANPDRMRRFHQEAKTASSLNHPNIVTIHDIDSELVNGEPVHFIAMEYIAGQTLDRLIGHKGLRFREALKIAAQLADGLSAAHDAGIVHRDLKPSNVMVTAQGLVKILDFGLAKLTGPLAADAYAATESLPLGQAQLTEEGTILGTVAYMSPEQAEGKSLDARSDIFSFGSVLYEMITGHQAFSGPSKLSALSAILHKEPQPAGATVADVPPELEKILGRCFRKEPQRRWQTMADVKVALEELLEDLDSSKTAVPAIPKRDRRRMLRGWLLPALAGVLIGAVPAAYLAQRFASPSPPSFQRLTFRRGDPNSARFAPDGTIVYSADWDGAPSTLFLARPGARESRALGLPSGQILSISASGEMAILLDGGGAGTLARVPLGGGAPREILENVSSADWGPDGEALAVVRTVEGRHRLEYPVGSILYQTEGRPPINPRVSPDGKWVAFFEHEMAPGDYSVAIAGPNHPRQVLSRGWRGTGGLSWSPSGREIWFSAVQLGGDPALYAVTLSGRHRILTQVAGWMVMYDVARDGRVLLSAVNSRVGILYLPAGAATGRDLAWLDASLAYELSHDGTKLLSVELSYGEGRNSAIYLRDTGGSPAVHLGYGNRPSLSPDGKWVLSIRQDAEGSQLRLLPTRAGESRTVTAGMGYEAAEWFPDGKRILFTGNEPGRPVRSYVVDLAAGKPAPVTPEGVRAARVSPDGRRVVVTREGKLYLHPLENSGPAHMVSELAPGERVIRWSSEGKYLFLSRLEPGGLTISRLEIATGRKQLWREVKPPEPGASFVGTGALSADGKAFACSFQRDIGNLYLVQGLK